jgi:hypothetical protein
VVTEVLEDITEMVAVEVEKNTEVVAVVVNVTDVVTMVL